MTKIVDAMLNVIRPYSTILLVVFMSILFLIAGYYGYQKYAIEKTKFSDMANANMNLNGTTARILFFTVDWCPHCKKAKPEWDKFAAAKNGKVINGCKISCEIINCTDDSQVHTSDSQKQVTIAQMINKYDIASYPTVKLAVDGGDTIEYDSKITSEGLTKFLDTVLSV
jgi:thiol-disulfide isomerase/thioredoxin